MMFKVECLKDYLNRSFEDYIDLAIRIYMITDFISEDYPEHRNWYFNKQLRYLSSDERNVLFVRNPENPREIISMACLKKDSEEKKICTLYVSDGYRGLGIGSLIVNESLKWLGTTKPLVTLADYKLEMFRPLIEKYDWQLTEVVSGLYNDRSEELCFNGTLTKANDIRLEKKLQKRLINSLNKRIETIK